MLLFIFVIASESWQYNQTKDFSFFKTDHIVQSEDDVSETFKNDAELPLDEQLSAAHNAIENLQAENSKLKVDENSGIIDLIEMIAKKIGYGFGWAGVYFTLFVYLLHGQTPGKWIARIKIIQLDGKPLSVWASFSRYGGYAASVVTGLTAFIQIYWDPNRQGLHDKVASTVVVKL